MKASEESVQKLEADVVALGYTVSYEDTNQKKPGEIQQLYVYKNDKVIAKVSLMLACRVNTMFNGVGRKQKELLEILTKFSVSV